MATRAPILDPSKFEATCNVCGRRFLAHEVGKRGAPKSYDTIACARLARAWAEFQSAFGTVLPRLTLESLFLWRGYLLGAASERAWNKGLGTATRDQAVAAERKADKEAITAALAVARAKLAERKAKANPRRARRR